MKIEMRFMVEGQGPRRQLIVSADSLDEFSTADWFRQFLDIGGSAVQANVRDKAAEENVVLNVEIDNLRRQIEALKKELRPAPAQQPLQAPQPPRTAPSSFMDMNPNQMTNDIWASLSPQQQAEYQNKWLAQR